MRKPILYGISDDLVEKIGKHLEIRTNRIGFRHLWKRICIVCYIFIGVSFVVPILLHEEFSILVSLVWLVTSAIALRVAWKSFSRIVQEEIVITRFVQHIRETFGFKPDEPIGVGEINIKSIELHLAYLRAMLEEDAEEVANFDRKVHDFLALSAKLDIASDQEGSLSSGLEDLGNCI